MVEHPSTMLCENIVYDIVGYFGIYEAPGSTASAASAALTCRCWTRPAQRQLYKSVLVCEPTPRRTDQFARTMRTCSHLRRLVRALAIYPLAEPVPLDWLSLLPERALCTFKCTHVSKDLISPSAAFDAPAIRAVTSLTIIGILPTTLLRTILEFPRLEALTLLFEDCTSGSTLALPPGFQPPPGLKHLTLIVSELSDLSRRLPVRVALEIVSLLAPQLESLEFWPPPHGSGLPGRSRDRGWPALRPIATRMRALKRVALHDTGLSAGGPPAGVLTLNAVAIVPIMDDVALHNAWLEHVECSYAMGTALFYERLPATLRTLVLEVGEDERVGAACAAALRGFVVRAMEGGWSLREVTVRFLRPWFADTLAFEEVAEECAASGVVFTRLVGIQYASVRF